MLILNEVIRPDIESRIYENVVNMMALGNDEEESGTVTYRPKIV